MFVFVCFVVCEDWEPVLMGNKSQDFLPSTHSHPHPHPPTHTHPHTHTHTPRESVDASVLPAGPWWSINTVRGACLLLPSILFLVFPTASLDNLWTALPTFDTHFQHVRILKLNTQLNTRLVCTSPALLSHSHTSSSLSHSLLAHTHTHSSLTLPPFHLTLTHTLP